MWRVINIQDVETASDWIKRLDEVIEMDEQQYEVVGVTVRKRDGRFAYGFVELRQLPASAPPGAVYQTIGYRRG